MRAVVLLIATAAFAAVWTGDQQVQQEFLIARRAAAQQQLQEQQQLLADEFKTTRETFAIRYHEDTSRREVPSRVESPSADGVIFAKSDGTLLIRVEVELPLPAEIAPGLYQVVDETGATQRVRVPVSDRAFRDQDLYVLDRPDGPRQFFIRVTDVDAVTTPTQTAREQSSFLR